MGLLDIFNTYEGQQGLGLLAAAGARSDGAGFGQRLQEGLGSAEKWKQRQAQAEIQKQQMELQQMQMAQFKAQIEQQKRQEAAFAQKQAALPSLFRAGSNGSPSLSVDSLLPPEMRAGLPPQAAVAPQQAGIDVQRALMAGYSPEEISKLDALRNIGQNKVARTVKGMQNGREVEMQFDDYGRPVGQALEQFRAPIEMGLGDKKQLIDPYTLQPKASFVMGQSPDSVASNKLGWANFGLSNQRLAMDKLNQDKPQWIESLGGFVDPRQRVVRPAMDAQGNPIAGAGGKMTEDQAKAAGWLVQAENAFGNMNRATAANPDAAKPGFNDVLAAIPSFGFTSGVANMMRGSTRQQFLQGASSLSEALLRAATGAGVNRDEAIQKVRELTPQIGDDEATIKQKKDAIPLYIESLKMRAGPGAAKANNIFNSGTGSSGNQSDPLGLFTR